MTVPEKVKTLVVDDEKVIRDFLARLLGREGLDVQVAASGPEAIAMAHKEKFDLIFLDVRMPGMTGVEALKELKKIHTETKYIMMTGYAVDDLLREAEREGVLLSLQKPFEISHLLEFLKSFKGGAGSKDALSILVVDDDRNILDFFVKLLKDHKVMTVPTGDEAMNIIRKQYFDLVLLDVALESANGLDLYARMRTIRPDIEIIVITGYHDKFKDDLDKLNVRCCLTKPFADIEMVLSEINKIKRPKT